MQPHQLQQLARTARRHPLWVPRTNGAEAIERPGIEKIIPHRDPFLLLDAITDIDLGEQAIRGRRQVSADDPVFRGHFPGDPVYPGVLQLEILGQLGLCLIHFMRTGSTEITVTAQPAAVRALKVHFAQFFSLVRPGDDLTIVGRLLELNGYTATCAGQILCSERVCSFGVMEVYLADD